MSDTLVHGFNIVLQVRVGTLYTVRLTHGHFHWTVKRKYKHFQELHRDLYKHRMMLQLLPLARSVVCQSVCANKSIPSESCKIKSKYSLAGTCFFFPFFWIFKFLPKRFAKDRQQLRAMSEEMPSLHGTERTRRTSSKMVKKTNRSDVHAIFFLTLFQLFVESLLTSMYLFISKLRSDLLILLLADAIVFIAYKQSSCAYWNI